MTWSDDEKKRFIQGIFVYGRDWAGQFQHGWKLMMKINVRAAAKLHFQNIPILLPKRLPGSTECQMAVFMVLVMDIQ